jgi:micrococcal nuclease|tara:strand:- start:328 stop:750 length:423 start_codon:yes stop_codon:yes gene_type:complete
MYRYRCKITRVVDGDTVDVDIDLGFGVWLHKERVRIMGIDTPESRTRDLVEKQFGLAAKEHVKLLMPVGSMQTITTQKDKTGKFGRILGDFEIDGKMFTQIMIDDHQAVAYHGQNKEDVAEAHLKNRAILIENGSITLKE